MTFAVVTLYYSVNQTLQHRDMYKLGQLLETRVLRGSGYPGTWFYLKIKNITRVLPDPPGTRVPEYSERHPSK